MKQISNCCKAEVKPNREDLQRGETYYNVCTKCGKPCDLYVENEIEGLSDELLYAKIISNAVSAGYNYKFQDITSEERKLAEDLKLEFFKRLNTHNEDIKEYKGNIKITKL